MRLRIFGLIFFIFYTGGDVAAAVSCPQPPMGVPSGHWREARTLSIEVIRRDPSTYSETVPIAIKGFFDRHISMRQSAFQERSYVFELFASAACDVLTKMKLEEFDTKRRLSNFEWVLADRLQIKKNPTSRR